MDPKTLANITDLKVLRCLRGLGVRRTKKVISPFLPDEDFSTQKEN